MIDALPQDPRVQDAISKLQAPRFADPARALQGKGSKVEKLREVAQNFESLFIQTLLKSMRSTIRKSGLIDGGRGEEIFTGLLDQRLAEVTSQRGDGIGLARMIVDGYAKYVRDPEEGRGRRVDARVGADAGGE